MTALPFAVRPGDIMLLRGEGWLSDHIVELTAPGAVLGGLPMEASHVGVVTAAAPCVQVTEALSRVRTRPIEESIANARHAWIAQLATLTEEQRAEIVRKALSFSADDYGYVDIGFQALDGLLRTRWFTQHWAEKKLPICSMLDALTYQVIGIEPGVDAASATPNDWARYVTTHPGWRVEALR